MAFAPVTYQATVDTLGNPVSPTNAIGIAAGASTTIVKATPGRVASVVVTAAGTGGDNATIYDNTAGSGLILGIIAGGTTAGTILNFNVPAAIGITVVNVGSGPGFTISYS